MFEGQDFFWNSFYQSCFLLQPNSIDLTAKYCSLREGNSALMSTAYKESHPSVGYLPSCCNKHFWISDFLPQFSPPMASGCTCVLHKPIISPTSLCSLNNYACDKKATCSCAFRFTPVSGMGLMSPNARLLETIIIRLTKQDIFDKVYIYVLPNTL